jgi:hypothetical protein
MTDRALGKIIELAADSRSRLIEHLPDLSFLVEHFHSTVTVDNAKADALEKSIRLMTDLCTVLQNQQEVIALVEISEHREGREQPKPEAAPS